MPKKTNKITAKKNKPPVVTIMGHVDHGKTTLLDTIRKSNLTSKEAGGITQTIGGYQIDHKGQKITFIDTPGHAAFSKMRARGANITDIVVLVVAADDGIKPQTKESIKHIKTAAVPLIVAINKTDLKTSSPEMIKAQLVEEDINVEGYGGSVPVVEVSALKGTNIEKLLDTIIALAELEDLDDTTNQPLEAVVIESSLKKNQGPIATMLIQAGTLNLGDPLTSIGLDPQITGSAKRILSDTGQILTKAFPSTPYELLGLRQVPPVGTIFTTPNHLQILSKSLQKPLPTETKTTESPEPETQPPVPEPDKKPTTETSSKDQPIEAEQQPQEEPEKISIKIILLADTAGSLEAIKQNITEEVEIIHENTGEVTESDVLLAQNTNAVIIAFNVKISPAAKKLADIERVPVKVYQIIYKLLEDFQNQILKLLEPTIDEQELGVAKIQALFEIRGNFIAGCKVKSGQISIGNKVHLKRDDKIITDSTISSIKQGKIDAKKIKKGEECGIILKPKITLKENDLIIAFKKLDG